jgi:hypothetical protein
MIAAIISHFFLVKMPFKQQKLLLKSNPESKLLRENIRDSYKNVPQQDSD